MEILPGSPNILKGIYEGGGLHSIIFIIQLFSFTMSEMRRGKTVTGPLCFAYACPHPVRLQTFLRGKISNEKKNPEKTFARNSKSRRPSHPFYG